MEPLTLIAAATGILKATGLGDWIGRKLGGDVGERTAGKIVDIASAAAGMGDPQELLKSLQADRELTTRVQIALMDNEHELAMATIADLNSARQMQVAALQQSDIFSKRFIYWFASAWSLGVAVYIGCITFLTIPTGNQRFADTILGFLLGTILAGIFQFFFGSSIGSKLKTLDLSQLLRAKT